MFAKLVSRGRDGEKKAPSGGGSVEPLNQSLGMWGSLTRALSRKASTSAGGGGSTAAAAAAAAVAAPAKPAAAPAGAREDGAGHEHGHVPATYPGFTPFVADEAAYREMYARSISDPDGFWADIASEFHWEKKWNPKHCSWNFDVRKGPVYVKWFEGATTNVCYNALDRHIKAGRGGERCFLWEGNEPSDASVMTYAEVHAEVCRMANYLRSKGVKKGDAVSIYMPMVCELPIAMLACARVGAVHSVVFGGFSAESLAQRIADCKAKVLITASGVMRGAKRIDLKAIADKGVEIAAKEGHKVTTVVVHEVKHAQPRASTAFTPGRDVWWEDAVKGQAAEAAVEWVEADHPLFLLYTSGSTGKPKGVVHCTGGYMVYTYTTSKYVFNMAPGDVYWCTADCGWITGHSYLTYGPMLVGATQVVFEGVPTYPGPDRCWAIVDKYSVKQFYTAPTAIRSLMRAGDGAVKAHGRQSLQILGSVGEPINPEAWLWYHDVVGDGRCPVADTWWQTETGGHMITPLPNAWRQKPGSATLPFFGVVPALVDDKNHELEGEAEGMLCIKQGWPSCVRTVYGDHQRYETVYFAPFPGYYFSGDGARRDKDGYYWITGRVDDVINVSGHRIGTAEVESALVAHPKCAEAAVVGYDHPIKGQGIYAYVTLMEGEAYAEELRRELVAAVRNTIGAFAAPDVVHWAPALPKTRSGKIMRRVLRKIAAKQEGELGDTSTLADPSVVQQLVDLRGK